MDVTQIGGTLILFFLMLAVGLELSPADFRRVLATPVAVIAGTLGQVLLLPAMTWAVVWALDLRPIFGAGAVLVAVSPGAGLSNILAALSRANIALSVTLTGVASVLAVVTLPTVAAFGIGSFLDDSIGVEVPVGRLMFQLLLTILAPIGLGMWLRARREGDVEVLARRLTRAVFALGAVVIVLAIATADDEQLDFEGGAIAFVAAGLWTLLAMAIGWTIARALRLSAPDRFTFVIEFSARNVGVASIVALSGLGRVDLTIFGGMYAAVGFPMVISLALWRRWTHRPDAP